MCKKIHRGGNAEQYNADKKYKEAVAVAVEACAEDTKGQTCYICTQALHWKTKEGLVRGCSCRGTAGFAHVSCLAEQAKIVYEGAGENNLSLRVKSERWARWHTCSLCEQLYHGVVKCALGWACWKTYLGRPEGHGARLSAMLALGNGLKEAGYYEDAESVQEADLATRRRLGAQENDILFAQTNLATTYEYTGRLEEALQLRRDVLHGFSKLGEEHGETLRATCNYASTLNSLKRYGEAKTLLKKTIPVAQRVLEASNEYIFRMRGCYAEALYADAGATLDDLREAVTTFEDLARIARRTLGGAHPLTAQIEQSLQNAREILRLRTQ